VSGRDGEALEQDGAAGDAGHHGVGEGHRGGL
jgi:hypothetical protein